MMRVSLALILLVATAGCAPGEVEEPGLPDSDIGLSKGDIEDTPTPEALVFNESEPAERPLPERAYPGSPPPIPHGSAIFLPITFEDNYCIDCHMVEEKEPDGPTPIPESHFVDLRNDPGEVRSEVAGARHNCITCHAPQTDAEPLVANSMGG